MLPTPSTSHVSFDTVYEPSEDSYLFLDTLSSPTESTWLATRFNTSSASPTPSPLIVEVGTGSGVVLGFAAAHAREIFGRSDIIALGTDVNRNACLATRETAVKAIQEQKEQQDTQPQTQTKTQTEPPPGKSKSESESVYISSLMADLCSPLRSGSIDVLLFNPPYVPTDSLPRLPSASEQDAFHVASMSRSDRFDNDSYFLSLTYAGGVDGMETTERLLSSIPDVLHPERGVAYVLLCKQNRPEEVKERIHGWGEGWKAETVWNSGRQAGWEKLVIVRIWRDRS